MDNKLYSKYLNNLIVSQSSKDKNIHKKFAEYTDVNFVTAHGVAGFRYRDNNGKIRDLNYDDVSPVIRLFARDLAKENSNKLSFKHSAEDICWAWPSRVNPDEELAAMAKLASADDAYIDAKLKNNPNYANVKDEEKPEIYKKMRNGAEKYLILKTKGYQGDYPEMVNLVSRLYMEGNRLHIDFDEHGNNTNVLTEEENLCIVPKLNQRLFWSYIEISAAVFSWMCDKKIYRVSDTLAKDFIEQTDLAVPTDALKYLPFRSFAIDLSRTPEFNGYFDCVFVNVIEYNGDYKILLKVIDSEGIPANTGFDMYFEFHKGEDSSLSEEELREYYSRGMLDLFSKHKEYAKECAEEYLVTHGRNPLSGAPFGVSGMSGDKTLAKFLGFGSESYVPFYISAYKNYQPVPASKYRKLERFLLSTIFYLCCSNKTVVKTDVPLNESECDKEAYHGHNGTKVEVEQLGVDIDDTPMFVFNELDLNDDGDNELKSGKKGTGRGTSHKPHLVRGHFHHYRCGKGKKDVIYKYTMPYYTGVKSNIVSVTTIK